MTFVTLLFIMWCSVMLNYMLQPSVASYLVLRKFNNFSHMHLSRTVNFFWILAVAYRLLLIDRRGHRPMQKIRKNVLQLYFSQAKSARQQLTVTLFKYYQNIAFPQHLSLFIAFFCFVFYLFLIPCITSTIYHCRICSSYKSWKNSKLLVLYNYLLSKLSPLIPIEARKINFHS